MPLEGEPCVPLAYKNQLLTELELAGYSHIAAVIGPMQIIKQTTALTYHLEQSAAGTVIFMVLLQMLSEMVDPLREQSNLNVGTAGITVMHSKRFNCFVLLFHTIRFQKIRIW